MSDELEVLIRWEIGALEDTLEDLKKELNTLMIDRNTAALRMIALESAGLPYPDDQDDLASLDLRVESLVSRIQSTRDQIKAWVHLLQNLDNPQIVSQIAPMIRTVELQQRSNA